MSSKRSDILAPAPAPAPVPAAAAKVAVDYRGGMDWMPAWRGWWDTLKANVPLPIVILGVFFLGRAVESETFGAYNQRVVMLIGFNLILAVSLPLINGFSGQFSLGHAGFMLVGAYLAAYPALNLSRRLNDPAA